MYLHNLQTGMIGQGMECGRVKAVKMLKTNDAKAY